MIRSFSWVFAGACLGMALAQSGFAKTWVLKSSESFESAAIPERSWRRNDLAEKNNYADNGPYFHKKRPDFKEPDAYRASVNFGKDDWLRLESYSRSQSTDLKTLASVVADPKGGANKVLRIKSPEHTDGTVLRSAEPLPAEYRVCAKVGYADFGTGKPAPDKNGYRGGERALPWLDIPSINENGFYWLAILSAPPQPRNNVWIHHHRKAVIDSDNNSYPKDQGGSWSRIWDGSKFIVSGEHPVMVFILDKDHKDKVWDYDRTGQPFISWAGGHWNSEADVGEIRAVDAYKDNTWYEACIQKADGKYTLSVEGDFVHGGRTKHEGTIETSKGFDPKGSPDYFMMGDPHANFYEGQVFYDDIRLEVPSAER